MKTLKFPGSLRAVKPDSAVTKTYDPVFEPEPQPESGLTWVDRWRLQRERSRARAQALGEQVQAEEQARSEVRQHLLENGKAIRMGEITKSALSQQSSLFCDCNRETKESEKRLDDECYGRSLEKVLELESECRSLGARVKQGTMTQESADYLEAFKRRQTEASIERDAGDTEELVQHQRRLGRFVVSGFEVPPDESGR